MVPEFGSFTSPRWRFVLGIAIRRLIDPVLSACFCLGISANERAAPLTHRIMQ